MRVLKLLGDEHRVIFLYFLLAVVSISLIFSNKTQQVENMKLKVALIVAAIESEIAQVGDYFSLREENEKLLQENTRLALQLQMIKEIDLENQRLRKMLKFKNQSSFELLPAKVIGFKEHGLVRGLLLNIGKRDSVRKNMPVLVSDGLVGKIYQVGSASSLVQVINDRNFAASVVVQRSRVRAIISDAKGTDARLSNVPNRSDVKPGDIVVTSGLGGIFPGGIVVGKIKEVQEDPKSLFAKIKIEYAVELRNLEEVFVIKQLKEVN